MIVKSICVDFTAPSGSKAKIHVMLKFTGFENPQQVCTLAALCVSFCGFALPWINFRGLGSYHEIHEILCTTKFNTHMVL